MLRFLREKGKSWVLKVLLGFVALTFVSFGGFALTDGPTDPAVGHVAAWVGETPISVRAFEERYYRQAEALRRQLGDAYNEDLARRMGLRRQALDSLVLEELQMREARRLGIRVTDSDLALEIQKLPLFQEEGKFSPTRYRALLDSNGLTPRRFEEEQRRVVLFARLREYVGMGVAVDEHEARAAYEWRNAQAKVAAVRLRPEAFADEVARSEADLENHYEKNKNEFRTGPQRKVSWWRYPFSEAAKGVVIGEGEVESHYERTRARYARKESASVSQILLKLPADAKEDQIEASKKRLEDLRARVLKGEKFPALAKAHSEGPEAKQGGDLGTFSRGQMLPELERVAFALKAGEVSAPVRTTFGMHLLWARERVEAGEKPFAEVRKEVEADLRDLRARQRARSELRKIRYAVEDAKPEPALDGLQKGKTDFFEQGRPPAELPAAGVVDALAFGLGDQEKISREREGEGGVSFVRLEAKREPFVPEFQEVRAEVERSFLRVEGAKVAKRKAEDWLKELRDKKRNLKAVADAVKARVLKPDAFKRGEIPPDLGPADSVVKAAFALGKGEFGMSESGGDVILFEVTEAAKSDAKAFEAEKAEFRDDLLRLKQSMVFGRYLERLREAADVRIEENFVL